MPTKAPNHYTFRPPLYTKCKHERLRLYDEIHEYQNSNLFGSFSLNRESREPDLCFFLLCISENQLNAA